MSLYHCSRIIMVQGYPQITTGQIRHPRVNIHTHTQWYFILFPAPSPPFLLMIQICQLDAHFVARFPSVTATTNGHLICVCGQVAIHGMSDYYMPVSSRNVQLSQGQTDTWTLKQDKLPNWNWHPCCKYLSKTGTYDKFLKWRGGVWGGGAGVGARACAHCIEGIRFKTNHCAHLSLWGICYLATHKCTQLFLPVSHQHPLCITVWQLQMKRVLLLVSYTKYWHAW